jgi:DNA repair exonuclease SbcCD nuclease subunit
MQKADLILMADLHLTEMQPRCRTDNYVKALWRKVKFISELQRRHNCPVVCAGDIFDYWKASPNLIRLTTLRLPNKFAAVYGQHDLPQHNWKRRNKSGLAALGEIFRYSDKSFSDGNSFAHRLVNILPGTHFEMPPIDSFVYPGQPVLVWHKMVWHGKMPWPNCPHPSALRILKKYGKKFKLIVTGDNHKPFAVKYKKTWLVNPGSVMRSKADQVDHKPRVYLWYAKENQVEPVYLPIKKNVISREHIDKKTNHEERIAAFISKFGDTYDVSLSFEDNLELFVTENQIRKSTLKIIRKALDKETK